MSNPLTFPVFFSFFSLFCCWFVLGSCFFLLLHFFQHVAFLFSFFLFFLSFRVSLFICLLLVCSWGFFCLFFFLLLSIPAFFFVLFVDVVLWWLKTVVYGNQVRFESLKNSAGTSTNSDKCYIVIYSDTTIKTQEGKRMIKTQEGLL